MFFAAVAAGATVLTLAMPFLATDTLDKRMKAVALEREKIASARARANGAGQQGCAATSPKQYMKTVVDNFNLNKWVGQEKARAMLMQAGYPRPGALRHLFVLPHGDADRQACSFRCSIFSS